MFSSTTSTSSSRIPWIADATTNALKYALGDMPNSEFIIDPDGDGRVTCGELPAPMGRVLDRFDTNGDDAIDESELAAMASRVRQRPR